MKVEIDWQANNDFHGIRLYPETNEEMADLERFKSVELEPYKYHRIVNGNSINYLIKFQKEKTFEYPKITKKQFFWNRILNTIMRKK